MTKTTDRRDRLNRAIRSKWGYIWGFLMSLLVIAFTALSDLSVVFKVGVILIHVILSCHYGICLALSVIGRGH